LFQNLGTAYLHAGSAAEAIRNERLSLSLQPERVTPHTVIAEAAMAAGNFDLAIWEWNMVLDCVSRQAEGLFDRLSDHIPDTAVIRLRLGEAYYGSGDYRHAHACFEEAARVNPADMRAHVGCAKALLADGDAGAASEVLQKALLQQPDNREALLTMGKIQGMRGDLEQAASYFERVLELNPAHADAKRSLDAVRRAAGEPGKSGTREDARSVSAAYADAREHAGNLLREGRAAEALTLLQPLEKERPDDPELLFLMAFASDALQRIPDVIGYCRRAASLNQSDYRVHHLLGSACIKQHAYKEALQSFRRAAALQPQTADAWAGIGVASVKLQDYTKAKEAFEQAHKLKPRDVQIIRNLAAVCGKLGLTADAERYLLLSKV